MGTSNPRAFRAIRLTCCASNWWRSLRVQGTKGRGNKGTRKQGAREREREGARKQPHRYCSLKTGRKETLLTPLAPPTSLTPLLLPKSPSIFFSILCVGLHRLGRFRGRR